MDNPVVPPSILKWAQDVDAREEKARETFAAMLAKVKETGQTAFRVMREERPFPAQLHDDIDRLHRSLLEKQAEQPLPEGWYYRYESSAELDGNAWVMTVTAVPERIVRFDD